MALRSFRVNFRTRGGIDPNLWNQFWTNLKEDLTDIAGSGSVDSVLTFDVGEEEFLSDYEIAISGMAGKELDENT